MTEEEADIRGEDEIEIKAEENSRHRLEETIDIRLQRVGNEATTASNANGSEVK